MNSEDLKQALETLNKKDRTFVDYYASAAVERFRLRNVQKIDNDRDDFGGPIPALMKDQEKVLDINLYHLRHFIVSNQDDLSDINFLKEISAQVASDNIEKQRFGIHAEAQELSRKLIVSSWLGSTENERQAKDDIHLIAYQSMFLDLNTKSIVNEYVSSELTDLYKMAHDHYGNPLPLDRQIVVPFGSKRIMESEDYPRSNLGELKNAIDRLHQDGFISQNADGISKEAVYQLSKQEVSKDSDKMKEIMSDIDNELPSIIKKKLPETENGFGM